MTHIERAIESAITQGYEPRDHLVNYGSYLYAEPAILLDPLFWQALCTPDNPIDINDWLRKWHRFIDHLAEGRDAESFFAAL